MIFFALFLISINNSYCKGKLSIALDPYHDFLEFGWLFSVNKKIGYIFNNIVLNMGKYENKI